MNQVPSAGRPVPIGTGMSFTALQGSRMELGLRLNDWATPSKPAKERSGHVIDFIMDDKSWGICHLVVETGHRYSGKEIVISPKHIDGSVTRNPRYS